jgi:hypothetical protein
MDRPQDIEGRGMPTTKKDEKGDERGPEKGHGKGRRSPTAPQELQNPLDFVRTGLEAARGGAPQMFLWAGGSIVAVAALLLPALVGSDKAPYAFATFLVVTIALSTLTWLAAKNPGNFQIQREWRVVQQPLRGEKLDALEKELKAVHGIAVDAFKKAKSAGDANNFRANIFLVDYRRAPEGVGLELRIPAQFRVMMVDPKEWALAFQPGWGATGEAFRSAQPVLTTDRLYGVPPNLHDVYDELLSTDLKGIVSLPILDSAYASVIAVLNVDFVGLDVNYDDLNIVYDAVKGSARFANLKRLLNELDKAWLTIGLRSG